MDATQILILMSVCGPLLFCLDIVSLRRKFRAIEAECSDEATIKNRQEWAFVWKLRVNLIIDLVCSVIGPLGLLSRAGLMNWHIATVLAGVFILPTIITLAVWGVRGFPSPVWRWLVARPQ